MPLATLPARQCGPYQKTLKISCLLSVLPLLQTYASILQQVDHHYFEFQCMVCCKVIDMYGQGTTGGSQTRVAG